MIAIFGYAHAIALFSTVQPLYLVGVMTEGQDLTVWYR